MNHTPGPWHVRIEDGDVWGIYAGDKRIVETDSGYYPPVLADALLIADAPLLLETLEQILRSSKETEDAGDWLLWIQRQLPPIIAHARGET